MGKTELPSWAHDIDRGELPLGGIQMTVTWEWCQQLSRPGGRRHPGEAGGDHSFLGRPHHQTRPFGPQQRNDPASPDTPVAAPHASGPTAGGSASVEAPKGGWLEGSGSFCLSDLAREGVIIPCSICASYLAWASFFCLVPFYPPARPIHLFWGSRIESSRGRMAGGWLVGG